MALSDITKKITDDAKERVEAIRTETRDSVHAVDAETDAQLEVLSKESEDEIERMLSSNHVKVVATAEHEARLKVEEAKQESLNTVFVDAYKKISELNDSDYEALFKTIVARLPANTTGNVVVPNNRLEVSKRLLANHPFLLSAITEEQIGGGIIVTAQDAVFNLSLERLLEEVREKHDIALAELLFN